jgi:hypothetical protein
VAINVHRLGKLACNELDGLQDEQALRFNDREDEDKDRFAKTLGSVAGRRITYDELTGK